MISRNMCRFLKKVPLWPDNKSYKKLEKSICMRKYLKLHLLMNAKEQGYVGVNGKGENEGFYLSEKGREAIEEYNRSKTSTRLSIIAIIVSVLSFIVSAATFLGWGVQ